MRLLVAISSCGDFERNGCNQAMRDTWLPELAAHGVDYKFFFGFGQGIDGAHKPESVPKDGEFLWVPDGYGYLTYKTQSSLRWAAAHNYDFVFRCFPDTYAKVDRLMACGFEQHDYHGDFRNEEGGRTNGGTGVFKPTLQEAQNYASGGPGYFLSRKAYTHLLNAPILGVWRDDLTPYVEDLWTGNILGKCGTKLEYFDDRRFVNHGSNYWPKPKNDAITAHMSCPDHPYDVQRMYAAHKIWNP